MSLLGTVLILAVSATTIFDAVRAEDVALPASVKTCKRDSDDYSSCLRLAIQESWPTIVQGIPEANIPVLDPFVMAYQEHDYEVGGVLGKIVMKNVKSYGMKNIRFLSVKPRYENDRFSLEIDLEMPKVFVEGDYKVEGSIANIRIGGKGRFNLTMETVRVLWEIDGPVLNDKWVIESFKATPEIGKLKVWASDLFNGNEEFTKLMLDLVNSQWPMFYRGMLPFVVESTNAVFRDLANGIFSKLSFAKTFP